MAQNGGSAFFGIFLYRAGVPVPLIFLAIGAILATRLVFRPVVLACAVRRGLRFTVALGASATALQYLALPFVSGPGPALLVYCLLTAFGDSFYWTAYHAYFAALGDAEHRAKQVAVREAAGAIIAIVAPIAGGWAIGAIGPRETFALAALVQLTSALPLLGTPRVAVARTAPDGAWRATRPGFLLFLLEGAIASGYIFVWQVAVFLSLDARYGAYGGTLALAGLAGAVGSLVLGRLIDAGHGRRAVALTFGCLAALTLARGAAPLAPAWTVTLTAAGALVNCLYMPTAMTIVYNLSKRAPCSFRFQFACEAGWDIGGAAGCLVAAAMSAAGLAPRWPILLSLLPILTMAAVLRRHYAGRSARDRG